MLKHFLSTAAVLALMAGPAYAQADQAGKGTASGSDTSTTMEKSDSMSGGTSGSDATTGAAESGSSGSTMSESGSSGDATSGGTTSGSDTTAGSGTSDMSPSADKGDTAGSGESTTSASSAASSGGSAFLTAQDSSQWRAESLIGTTVMNSQDEEIGQIDDLVFDQEGKVKAAVVSVGGFLGIGSKNVAVNWDQLQIRSSEGAEEVMVSMTREQLENAPDFKTIEDQRNEDAARDAQMQQGTTSPPTGGMGTTN